MRLRILFLIWAVFLTSFLLGQRLKPCATATVAQNEWLSRFQERLQPEISLRGAITLYFPVQIFVSARVHQANGVLSPVKLMDEICHINHLYKQVNIEFYQIAPPVLLHDLQWDKIETQTELSSLISHYNNPNAIPIYIVENGLEACGFNMIRNQLNQGILISAECYRVKGALLAHELGHYLGLPHTFNGWEGKSFDYNQKAPENWENIKVERADGSNCKTAGDGFCDTAPDYLSLRWSCADSSKSPIPLVDPMGKSFYSDGSLIMGYALDPCPNRFSREQIITMRAYSDVFHAQLFKTDLPIKVSKTEPATGVPADLSQINVNNGVTFRWEKVPGTYKYLVEVSPMPNMAIVTNSYEISGDSLSLTANNLIAGRRYYWRLRSLNLYTACLSLSKIKSFNAILSTSNQEFQSKEKVLVKVNPVNQLDGIQLDMEGQSFPLSLALTNSTGQLLFTKNYPQYVGSSNLSISVSAFPPGQYTLTVRNAQKTQSHNVVIMP
jgi:hypothetical protein